MQHVLTMEGDSAKRGTCQTGRETGKDRGHMAVIPLANQYTPVQYGWINTLSFEDALLVDSG